MLKVHFPYTFYLLFNKFWTNTVVVVVRHCNGVRYLLNNFGDNSPS